MSRLLSFLALIMLFAGCQLAGPGVRDDDGNAAPPSDDLETLEAQIIELIGDAEASTIGQCAFIPFGSKPCGGPWRYLVYSTQTTNEATLEQYVARYNELDDARNRQEGLVSDCSLVGPPEIMLEGGQCQVRR